VAFTRANLYVPFFRRRLSMLKISLAATHVDIHLWTTQSTLLDVIPNYTLSETLVEPNLSLMAKLLVEGLLAHLSLSLPHPLQLVDAPIR
jgi:hypothetical protein